MTTDNQQTDNTERTIEAGDLSNLLQEYRSIAHLDIDQVADSLCLTKTAITALENEEFSKLPESPYIRGYLRNYARLANRDSRHIIEVYNTLRGEPNVGDSNQAHLLTSNSSYQEVAKPLVTHQWFRLALLAGLLLLLSLLTMIPGVKDWTNNVWNNFSPTSDTISSEDTPTTNTPLNLPSLTGDVPGNLPISPEESPKENETVNKVTTGNEEAETANSDHTKATENSKEVSEDSVASSNSKTPNADSTKTDEEATTDTTQEEPITNQEETTETDGSTQLKLVFAQEVWLRIKGGNGAVLYEALHPANTEKELSLKSPLKFKVGNAPAMQLFVNGEEMDTAQYTNKGSIARFSIELSK